MIKTILEETNVFLEHLGLDEAPFGVYYNDTKPEESFGPKPGIPISREMEDQGQVDMQPRAFAKNQGSSWRRRSRYP